MLGLFGRGEFGPVFELGLGDLAESLSHLLDIH